MADQQTPERVTSEPVPVPPPVDDADRDRDGRDRDDAQRDAAEDVTDRVPEDTLNDRGTFEDPVLTGERNDPDDLTAVNPRASDFNEPAPQRTAFGAATVGGAAAAAAQAGPSHEVRDGTDPEVTGAAGDRDVDADRTAEERDLDADRGAEQRDLDADLAAGERDLDADRATEQRDLDADLAAGERDLDADRAVEERAYQDAAEQPPDSPSDLPETPAAVDTPAETAPTAVEEPIAGLWGEDTAQGYRDRWREVQLRFIDDPSAAAREANLLVEEAVGALTAELSRQKEALSGWSGEDTEQLRSVVRRHRDFLDRLLGL